MKGLLPNVQHFHNHFFYSQGLIIFCKHLKVYEKPSNFPNKTVDKSLLLQNAKLTISEMEKSEM